MVAMDETLTDWGPILAKLKAPQVNDSIYEYLSPLNRGRFCALVNRLNAVRSFKTKSKRRQGKRSYVQGKIYEKIVRLLFSGPGALVAEYPNLRTTTSEVDIVLFVQPLGMQWIPMLHKAGTQLVVEVKCHLEPPGSELINEFAGFLGTHNTSIGLLFVGCKSRQLASEVRQAIALHVQHSRFVVVVGEKQIAQIKAGANALRILSEQFALTQLHSSKLAVLVLLSPALEMVFGAQLTSQCGRPRRYDAFSPASRTYVCPRLAPS